MMIITRDNQRLYLRPLDFNMCRIFSALADIIENHGGRVKPQSHTALISDRNLDDSEVIPAAHTDCISFVFDGMVYYFQIDQNPCFPFYYNKTPLLASNKYSRDASLAELSKTWLYDCFWRSNCSQSDIVGAANLIFHELCNAPTSKIIRPSRRVRVPNIYNDRWHWETVYEPERVATLDW